jgi:hypothetical protein
MITALFKYIAPLGFLVDMPLERVERRCTRTPALNLSVSGKGLLLNDLSAFAYLIHLSRTSIGPKETHRLEEWVLRLEHSLPVSVFDIYIYSWWREILFYTYCKP